MYHCRILSCNYADVNLRRMVTHMRNAHCYASNLHRGCLLDCGKTFSTVNSLRFHILNSHKVEWDEANESDGNNFSRPSHVYKGAEPIVEVPNHAEGHVEDNVSNVPKESLQIYERMMANTRLVLPSLFLKLQYKYNIPRRVSKLVHDEYMHSMRMIRDGWSRALCGYASELSDTIDPQLITMMTSNEMDHVLRTSKRKENAQMKVLGLVKPVEVDLKAECIGMQFEGNPLNEVEPDLDDVEALLSYDVASADEGEIESPTISENLNAANVPVSTEGKKEVYHYVPLLETLKKYLQFDDVVDEVLRGGSRHQMDGIYSDFSSGHIYSRTPRFAYDPHHLRIALYTDELTVTNPLAAHSRKHKLAVVYFVVNNIQPKFLSSLRSIHLLLICRWKLVEKFSYGVVLKRLMNDLTVLEEDGVEITTNSGRKLHFFGSLAVISADNLSAHALGGFRCCFSSGKICRFCLTDHAQRKTVHCNADCTLRTEESIQQHANLIRQDPLLCKVFGIQCRSCLYNLPGYNPLTCLPPDVMHDILECFMPIHLQQLIRALHRTKTVTFCNFQKACKTFKYQKSDASNKHPGLVDDWIEKKKKAIGGTAAEKWTLFRLMPYMLGPLVPKDNKHWELFKLSLKIAEIVLALKVSDGMLTELANLIQDHHEQWTLLYPDIFPAKFHFLVHYPKLMQEFGPLRLLWCMRFESFHQIIKGIILRARNFCNVSKTASERFQKRRCLEYADSSGLPPSMLIHGSEKIVLLREVETPLVKECVAKYFNCAHNSSLTSVKHISLDNHTVFVESYCIVSLYCDVLPIFFKIKKIFVLDDSVGLFGYLVGTDYYDEHYQAYALTPLSEDNFENFAAIGPSDIISPQTMNAYDIGGNLYIRYRFRPVAK